MPMPNIPENENNAFMDDPLVQEVVGIFARLYRQMNKEQQAILELLVSTPAHKWLSLINEMLVEDKVVASQLQNLLLLNKSKLTLETMKRLIASSNQRVPLVKLNDWELRKLEQLSKKLKAGIVQLDLLKKQIEAYDLVDLKGEIDSSGIKESLVQATVIPSKLLFWLLILLAFYFFCRLILWLLYRMGLLTYSELKQIERIEENLNRQRKNTTPDDDDSLLDRRKRPLGKGFLRGGELMEDVDAMEKKISDSISSLQSIFEEVKANPKASSVSFVDRLLSERLHEIEKIDQEFQTKLLKKFQIADSGVANLIHKKIFDPTTTTAENQVVRKRFWVFRKLAKIPILEKSAKIFRIVANRTTQGFRFAGHKMVPNGVKLAILLTLAALISSIFPNSKIISVVPRNIPIPISRPFLDQSARTVSKFKDIVKGKNFDPSSVKLYINKKSILKNRNSNEFSTMEKAKLRIIRPKKASPSSRLTFKFYIYKSFVKEHL